MDAASEMIVCRPVIQVADKAPLTPRRRQSSSVVNPGEPAPACVPQGRPELDLPDAGAGWPGWLGAARGAGPGFGQPLQPGRREGLKTPVWSLGCCVRAALPSTRLTVP